MPSLREVKSCALVPSFYPRIHCTYYTVVFRPQKPLKKTRVKLYNTLVLPVLLYGSETWIIKSNDARRMSAAEMKYMRRTAEYTWTDYKTNTQIAKDLKITPIIDKLLE
jgi:hypothetical protein